MEDADVPIKTELVDPLDLEDALRVGALECEGEPSVIPDFLAVPFASRDYGEQCRIVETGRPCPALPELKCVHKDRRETYTRTFNVSQYERYPWLTGCAYLNKLFCWPCLLFSTNNSSVWSSEGYDNLNNLQVSQRKHKCSVNHLQSSIKLDLFIDKRAQETVGDQKVNTLEYNKRINRNRKVLQRLIDVICLLVNQDLSLGINDETFANSGNYVEFIHILRKYDYILDSHLESDTSFKGTSQAIQYDVIKAIAEVTNDLISQETDEAPFVAIMLDTPEERSKLSTVLRYTHKGEIKERFLKFLKWEGDVHSIVRHIDDILHKYNLQNKFIAISYDAVTSSKDFNQLHETVSKLYPKVHQVHSYAHLLNFVCRGLCDVAQCKEFFATLSGLVAFGSSSNRGPKEYLKVKVSHLDESWWKFTAKVAGIIDKHKGLFLEYFDRVINEDGWQVDEKMAAVGYKHFLQQFKTVVLLKVFSFMFSQSHFLFEMLQSKSVDVNECKDKIMDFLNYVYRLGDEDFDTVWMKISELMHASERPRKMPHLEISDRSTYLKLFREIKENVISNLKQILNSFGKLEILDLLNCKKFCTYRMKGNFSEHLFVKVLGTYSDVFEASQLRNELLILYGLEDSSEKSACDIAKWIHDKKLSASFEQVDKLASLIATIPISDISMGSKFETLKEIAKIVPTTHGQQNELFQLYLEKKLLAELKSRPEFHDMVIEKFTDIAIGNEFKYV